MSRDALKMAVYSDVDFAADKTDNKSLTDRFVLLSGITVSLSAEKQGGSLSTIEVKFPVASSGVARGNIGQRQMLMEIDMALVVLMLMHVDNQDDISQIEGEASASKITSTCGTSLSRLRAR